jgi:outer membrane protein assembly factor BamA
MERLKRGWCLLLLIMLAAPAGAFKVGQAGTVNGVPYVIYNSTYGLYYGVIGKAKNLLGREESLALSAFLISNGGSGANFVLALPDDDYRHGKMFPLGFDLAGVLGRTVAERYYGLGSGTPGSGYTTLDNVHNKLTFQFTRPFSARLLGEADLFVASNQFSNIVQGANPITAQIQAAASNYTGGTLKLAADTRDQSLDPHAGAYLIGQLDCGLSNCDYAKGTIDLRSYLTPFRPDQVLAARFQLAQAAGDTIPIYEYPFLGGKDTMRGYTMNRWRDRASVLVDLEYRFPLFYEWFQTAVFYETGKVGSALSGLGADNWVSDHGFGLHFILGGNVVVRGDLGFGQEGTNAYFFYNQAF